MQAREEDAIGMAECLWVRQVLQSNMLPWLPAADMWALEELLWPPLYQGSGGSGHQAGGGGQPGKVNISQE